MAHRAVRLFPLAMLSIAAISACGSATAGTVPSSGPTSHPSPSPTGASTDWSGTDTSSTTSSSDTAASTDTAPPGAAYFDNFSDPSSGWGTTSQSAFISRYYKGTYQLAVNDDSAHVVKAPYNITKASHTSSVVIDVLAAARLDSGETSPPGAFGVTCWDKADAGSDPSDFSFFIHNDVANLDLYGPDGAAHRIDQESVRGALKVSSPDNAQVNQIQVTCAQVEDAASGEVDAVLQLQVNGTTIINTRYAATVHNYEWKVGPYVGLTVSGKGEDALFSDFTISPYTGG